MLTVTCIQKFRDNNGAIEGYLLQDNNGDQRSVNAYALKNAIYNGQILVDNLRLTSDGRLIDKKPDEKESDVYGIDISGSMEHLVKKLSNALTGILVKNEIVSVPDSKTGGSLYGIKVWAGTEPGAFIGYSKKAIKGKDKDGQIILAENYEEYIITNRIVSKGKKPVMRIKDRKYDIDVRVVETLDIFDGKDVSNVDYVIVAFRLEKIRSNDNKHAMHDITAYGETYFKNGEHKSTLNIRNNVRVFNRKMNKIEDTIAWSNFSKASNENTITAVNEETLKRLEGFFVYTALDYIFNVNERTFGFWKNVALNTTFKVNELINNADLPANEHVNKLRGAASFNRSMDNYEEEAKRREEAAAQLQKKLHEQESIEKLQNSKTVKDIFNTFKR